MEAASERSYTTAELLAYFNVTRPGLAAPAAALTSRYTTPTVVGEILEHCENVDPEQSSTGYLWAVAASSPHTNPELLCDWVANNTPRRAEPAAANPALDPDLVAELWERTGHLHLLSNPHIDPGLLGEHLVGNRDIIATNPAASPEILTACLAVNRRAVLVNPACPRELLDPALVNPRGGDVWAIANPRLTLEELLDLDRRYRELVDEGAPWARQAVVESSAHIRRRLTLDSPRDVPAEELHLGDVNDPLAEVLITGGDCADAVTALLRGGFTGTVGTLLACAAAVTATCTPGRGAGADAAGSPHPG